MTLRTLGELELSDGRLDRAEERLRDGMRLWQAIDLPLHVARTQRDLAAALEAGGDCDAAEKLRAHAIETFRLYGARS